MDLHHCPSGTQDQERDSEGASTTIVAEWQIFPMITLTGHSLPGLAQASDLLGQATSPPKSVVEAWPSLAYVG